MNWENKAIKCFKNKPTDKDADLWWDGSGWYFLDETWADFHGPFEPRKECFSALKNYAESL